MQKRTVEVLKNFSTIYRGVTIKKGSEIRTRNPEKTIFAIAGIPDEFNDNFTIFDLPEFLATFSLFTEPVVEFKDEFVKLSSNVSSIKYYYSNERTVPDVYSASPKLPDTDIKFTLTKDTLEQLLKVTSVMKLKDIVISSAGIVALNTTSVGNEYYCGIDDIELVNDTDKKYIINVENLKMIPDTYNVNITNRAAQFISAAGDLVYLIALECQ